MREVDVDAVDAEPSEARVDLPADAIRCEAVVLALGHRRERLRRDADPLGLPGAEPLADVRLAAAAAVCVGGVEPREARGVGSVEELERLLLRVALPEERWRGADTPKVPATEDDDG